MNNASYPDVSHSEPDRSPITREPGQTRSFSLFHWWYQLTTPAEPASNATFICRDSYRKARLFSNVAFFLIAALVFSAYLFLPNPYLVFIAFAEIVVSCVCLYLNRIGRTLIACILQVISFEFALTSVILTMLPLNSASTQILDLFIVGELLAASLLPVRSVSLVALYNSLFIWLNISYQSHTPDMIQALYSQFTSIVTRGVGLQFMVAGISSLWVYNTRKAISSGYKVAKLEHILIEQRKELEAGIEQILQTHVSVANGNLNARVPLAQDHLLWHVARALNSLLVRLQRTSVSERELHRVEHAVTSTVNIIQKSDQQHQQARIPFTQTAIDPLIASMQGKTFAFTKPLQQQNNAKSTDPMHMHTFNTKMPSRHTPP